MDAELIMGELRVGGIDFESQRVQNGADFEREITQFHPDLILADFRLPTFDGAQALSRERQRDRKSTRLNSSHG